MTLAAFYLFLVETFAFFIATLNFRFCAKGHVKATVLTDMLIAANGFIAIKLVAEATTAFEMFAYVIGAAVGSLAAMRLTKGLEDRDGK